MDTLASDKKISDMTVGELRELIRDVIMEVLDPDYGLELRPEVIESLQKSLEQQERGEFLTIEEVEERLGLK